MWGAPLGLDRMGRDVALSNEARKRELHHGNETEIQRLLQALGGGKIIRRRGHMAQVCRRYELCQTVLGNWNHHYNTDRPHGGIGGAPEKALRRLLFVTRSCRLKN